MKEDERRPNNICNKNLHDNNIHSFILKDQTINHLRLCKKS